jgi:hypothetical protein
MLTLSLFCSLSINLDSTLFSHFYLPFTDEPLSATPVSEEASPLLVLKRAQLVLPPVSLPLQSCPEKGANLRLVWPPRSLLCQTLLRLLRPLAWTTPAAL